MRVEREFNTDTMFGENCRLRVDNDVQMVDVSVDLNKSLRTRSKGVGSYLDAKDLADDFEKGHWSSFKSITLDDNGMLSRVDSILRHLDFDVPGVAAPCFAKGRVLVHGAPGVPKRAQARITDLSC